MFAALFLALQLTVMSLAEAFAAQDSSMETEIYGCDGQDEEQNKGLDEEEIEYLRMFFIEEINKHNKSIKVYSSEDGYPIKYHDYFTDSVKDSNDFYERVFNIINERLIPYMVLHHGRDTEII